MGVPSTDSTTEVDDASVDELIKARRDEQRVRDEQRITGVTVYDFHQLRADIQNTEDRHEEIHREIKSSIGEMRAEQHELGRQVSDVRASAAATSASSAATADSVKRLVAFVDTTQKAQLRVATANEEAAIEDGVDKKKHRRALFYKVAAKVAVTVVGLAAGFIALQHC
jgi:hypothetical protein